ncbi:MAG: hypothetical protein Q9M36_00725 [Sulfurovum sp.]|nr:hypothetical protein [Sulfurovum sp.]
MKILLLCLTFTTLIFSNMRMYVSHNSAISTITLQEIKNLYLKKTTLLHNKKVTVYDNKESYSRFSQMILKKKDGAMHAYWMKQIFLGKNVPPRKIPSSHILTILNQDHQAIIYSDKLIDAKVIYVHQ